ncbi:MAG TPA: tetratricopeptide repeat protein [Pseudolabrys sp.]|jgi:predicted O-linked N-acetylglucosamine transferase (SPINDLY family)
MQKDPRTNTGVSQLLAQAISAFRAGNPFEAHRLCAAVIDKDKKNTVALHLSGVIEALRNNSPDALRLFDRALKISPHNADILADKGNVLGAMGQHHDALLCYQQAVSINAGHLSALQNQGATLLLLKRFTEALAVFDRLLQIAPNHAPAFNNRGEALKELGRGEEAIASYRQATVFDPQNVEAWSNLGDGLFKLKRHDEAFGAYDKALALKPDLAEAWLGRGNISFDLKRDDDALGAYDKALSHKPDLAEAWLGRGNVFNNRKRYHEAFDAYDKALARKADLAGAWLGRGNVFYRMGRYEEAFAAYDKTLALKPDLADAWLGRGNVFYELKRNEDASSDYDKALVLNSDLAEAWLGRGNIFFRLKRYGEAFDAYDKAFSADPGLTGLEGARLHTKMHLCDWASFEAERAHLDGSVRNGKTSAPPFAYLATSSSPDDQLRCAELWIADKFPASKQPIWRGERFEHERIRVAYVSADFRHQPMSYLLAGLFECHDRARFETFGLSLGPDDNSDIRKRLGTALERFINVTADSDDRIASQIAELEIDILVDLMGFTAMARTGIFAKRPAPIQISYLGYPGTMGADYIDYILADRIVVPQIEYRSYSEKVIALPDCYYPTSYQINDARRAIAERTFTRAELGLPAGGFVFCCFNNAYKILPHIFDRWMRILRQVEGSVLWLLTDQAAAMNSLRKEAAARGVDAARLIFANSMPQPDHLARHRLADLFLDTLPYNAHTTASDALWMGVPVLTLVGETFAGRVAASLLGAIHLPELITTTPDAYERRAIELATQPEQLGALKRKLGKNRLTTPLFDTQRFTRQIEAAFTAIHRRHQAGLAPDHIVVPP